jgi:hypothetical protein
VGGLNYAIKHGNDCRAGKGQSERNQDMTGSVGGLMGKFFIHQYHAFMGSERLASTFATNPSTSWKIAKRLAGYDHLPHREALERLRGIGVTVRVTGKTEIV